MEVDEDLEREPSAPLNGVEADAPPGKAAAPKIKKITVQLSETMFERLEAATERPGLGKSMVVEAALEHFLNHRSSTEGRVQEGVSQMTAQLGRLERAVAIIAETVALHARYHLTVVPPIPHSQQRQACLLGQQRFRVLAEQVERRVRLGQPLIEEIIDRVRRSNRPAASHPGDASRPSMGDGLERDASTNAAVDGISEPDAAAGEGGSTVNFRNLPNSF